MRWLTPFLAIVWLFGTSAAPKPQDVALDLILGSTLPPRLSDFRFFLAGPSVLHPNKGVTPYTLNTPLFSDYSEKERFVWMPPGKKAHYRDDGVLDFPVGTALIKSFGYPTDFRVAGQKIERIETRILLRRANGWVALPYVWDADGRDATLWRAGKRISRRWIDAQGIAQEISYAIPNANQCKGCHDKSGAITPIGPKIRNLNNGKQLQAWVTAGLLNQLPQNAPRVPVFGDIRAPLTLRARAYLDVNCGHCHNPEGPANTSGLWLDWGQKPGIALGIGKRPTAAGRGSGNLNFAISPGDPDRSIMIYRMKSLEPGIAMPELGRAMVHQEGVELLSTWIRTM